jgi:ProP effector
MHELNLPAPSAEGDRRMESSVERRNDPSNSKTRPDPASAKATLAALAELFPALFVAEAWQQHKPLKIGVANDLVERGVLLPTECRALSFYCRRRLYQAALAAGGPRFDLDGNVAGEVTPEQVENAKASLAGIEAKRARRGAATLATIAAAKAKRKAEKEARRAQEQAQAARAVAEKPDSAPPHHEAKPESMPVRAPEPAGPKRLSLTDLKRAAQERRQAEASSQ